jgi:hypothetical protein
MLSSTLLQHLCREELRAHPKKPTLILVRYVNNFVVLHQSREVILLAQTFLEEWLKCMGLKLHPDKTLKTEIIVYSGTVQILLGIMMIFVVDSISFWGKGPQMQLGILNCNIVAKVSVGHNAGVLKFSVIML